MQFRKEKRCPSCGHLLVEEEKIRYGGKNDCRSEPFMLCPACGWKRRGVTSDDNLFDYHV